MKKTLSCLLCLSLLLGCDPEPFIGYIVCKEYTPGHLDDKRVSPIQVAVAVPVRPIIVPHRHKPKWVKSRWVVYVANKNSVRSFNIDSINFINVSLGQKITINTK